MSAPNFDSFDFSALPRPAAIVEPDFEAILDARMLDYLARWTQRREDDPTLPPYDMQALETDPAKILQEVDAYRETLKRAEINDAVYATHLAWAVGADLDNCAGRFKTFRAAGETDYSLRRRAQLALELASLGGSYGGYRKKALDAAPVDLVNVAVYGHEVAGVAKGEVRIVCLGWHSSGSPGAATLSRVRAAFPRELRKVNDLINVVAATAAPYAIDATLTLRADADAPAVVAAQKEKALAFAASRRDIAAFVTPNGVAAALGHDDPGLVLDVTLRSPRERIAPGLFGAPILAALSVDYEVAP